MARTLPALLLLLAGCSFDLDALRGSSRADAGGDACVPTAIALTGSFPGHLLRNVTALGGSIALTDSFAGVTGTIALGPGITATGSFVPCMTEFSPCGDWLNSVSASGSTMTFTSVGEMGGPPMVATITLVGATAVGSVTAVSAFGFDPGYFRRAWVSGDTITFEDGAGNEGTITLTRTGCL